MTAATAICGLLPILLLRMHGTGIERPPAIVMTGGLVTSTIFILPELPTIYPWFVNRSKRMDGTAHLLPMKANGSKSPVA